MDLLIVAVLALEMDSLLFEYSIDRYVDRSHLKPWIELV